MLVGCAAHCKPVYRNGHGLIKLLRGKLDNFMMRIVDILYSVPRLIFI
jgi:hypothetical protein